MRSRTWVGWGLAALLSSGLAQAGVTTYQSNATFQAAISGLGAQQTTNFDGIAVGTQYASGTGLGGFTLTALASGGTPQVNDKMADGSPLWTTSGTHSWAWTMRRHSSLAAIRSPLISMERRGVLACM